MKKILLISSLILLVPYFSANAQTASTSQESTATSTPQVLGLQAPAIPPLVIKIQRAKNLLAPIKLKYNIVPIYKNKTTGKGKAKKTVKVLSGYSLQSKDIILEIYDPATDNFKTITGTQTATSMSFPNSDVDVQLTRFNGVNSKFTVSRPAGGFVMALKYLISPVEAGAKKISKTNFQKLFMYHIPLP